MITAQEGFSMGVVGLVFGLLLGVSSMSSEWKQDAVERGLAQHCPLDGKWAWNGECDK